MDNKGMDSGYRVAGGDIEETEAQALLNKLEPAWARRGEHVRGPGLLPAKAVTRYEVLFQPRAEVPGHVEELVRVLRAEELLDPLLVIQIGEETVLIDGHHRHSAYLKAKTEGPVPVTYFDGTVREAVIEAGDANRKAKLPMTVQQRNDRA